MRTISGRQLRWAPTLLAALSLAACGDSTSAPSAPVTPGQSIASDQREEGRDLPGAVYTLTNDVERNAVIAFRRAPDGELTPLGTFATGGRGIGGTVDPLQSQFALVLSENHRALVAVDAGSNQLSSFRVAGTGRLTLASTVSSGGVLPVSLAVHGNLLYALNAGDNTLNAYRITDGARLVPLAESKRSLAPGANGAAAVRFTRDGRYLIVAERVSNRLEVFRVRPNGRLEAPVVTPGNGASSFGFDITARNQPIVSETQGSLTSYGLEAGGALIPITGSISTSGTAACWVTITSDGRFAYTTNSGSNALAGFAIDARGHLAALTPGSSTGESGPGAAPIDLDHVGARLLYVLEAGTGTIGTFVIERDGSLIARADTPAGDPASGLQGIAAY
jgi:6-phosphogluconolactonase (cycloisomerase 2 family)